MADVLMPQLGETVTEGTITKWFKQVGQEVKADEPLFEVSTDKVDTEVPSPVAGVLTEIRAAEGDTVAVGQVIAVVGAAEAAAPAAVVPAPVVPVAAPEPAPEPAAAAAPAVAAVPAAAAPAAAVPPPPVRPNIAPPPPPPAAPAAAPAVNGAAADNAEDNRLLSPVVRRLVNEHGLDPATIVGTGTGGRITREDVIGHIERTGAQPVSAAATAAVPLVAAPAPAPVAAPAAAPAARPVAPSPVAGARDEVVALSKIRKLTGDHMVMSKAVTPHAFSVVEVDYANVDKARNAVKGEWKSAEGFSLTYLPFISRAIVDAIADFPHMNASMGNGELVVHRYVDLGIAVDMDYQGLIVPVVRSADGKRLRAIAREINDLAGRARNRKLSPDEISGGTFTISNNGSAGSVLTAAIVNQPQVAIISTDAIKRRPVVVDLPSGGEAIAIHSVGNLAMSWDHRAFDGAYAANFLVRIKDILETRDWAAEM
jgi:2-oxoglutarate dehydrogenase E2 component (dihydrolipoamide succinyltransferase)